METFYLPNELGKADCIFFFCLDTFEQMIRGAPLSDGALECSFAFFKKSCYGTFDRLWRRGVFFRNFRFKNLVYLSP